MAQRDMDDAFSLGRWQVHPEENRITDGNRVIDLEPRVMSVLVCLRRNPGRICSTNDLLNEVWQGRAHGDHTVYQAIADLRKALGDHASRPHYVETIPKKGYRLIGRVSAAAPAAPNAFAPGKPAYNYKIQAAATGLALAAVLAILAAILHSGKPLLLPGDDPESKSIAVLPFNNLSDDPANEYFSDGLSEDILNLLGNIPGLKVTGRSSSFAFKGRNEDLRVIGNTLGVKTVLEGSVRRSGDRVRVSVQLSDTADGRHIWSATYDRELTEIFSVQSDVAAAVIDALQIHVRSDPVRGRPTENSIAYTLFLKARSLLNTFDYQNAEEMLLQAIGLDPDFAKAYELLAVVYFRQGGHDLRAVEGQRLTGDAAARALAINPDRVLARALFEAGNTRSWSYAREIAAFEQAAREQPNNPEILNALQWDLFVAGYLDEAAQIAERLVEIDPLSQNANNRLTDALFATGQSDRAIAGLELQANLGVVQATWDLGEFHLAGGRTDIALAFFEAHESRNNYEDPTWIRDFLVQAQDPGTGRAFLDGNGQQNIVTVPDESGYGAQLGNTEWYLYLGYLDRFFELIFAANPTGDTWNDADGLIYAGTLYRRLGFTAHPKYLEVAASVGLTDVWDRRGPPDFCEKVSGAWVCE